MQTRLCMKTLYLQQPTVTSRLMGSTLGAACPETFVGRIGFNGKPGLRTEPFTAQSARGSSWGALPALPPVRIKPKVLSVR